MYWKKRIFSLLKQFDLFGETFTFKIQKNSSYTSIIGGISSLAFVLYTLLFFFTNLRDFFSKTIRFSTIENLISPEVNISFSNHSYFMMAFCLRDSQMAVDSNFNSRISQKIFLHRDRLENKRLVSEMKPLEMETCRQEFFDPLMNEIYSQMDFMGCQCLNLTNQKEDITLMSKPNGVERDYFQYELSNETEIESYFESSEMKLHVYFPSYEVGSTNIDSPFQMSPIVEIFDLKPFTQEISDFVFSLINLYDHNSLFDDTQYDQDNRISFQKADSKVYYHPQLSKKEAHSLVKIQMKMDMNIINHNRRVLRYDDFLGNMVGYIYNIVIPIYIFNVMYNSFGAREYFAEKFFFKNDEFSKNFTNEIKNKINKLSNHTANNSCGENSPEGEVTQDIHTKVKECEIPPKNDFIHFNEEHEAHHNKVNLEIESRDANEKSAVLIKRDDRRNNFQYNYLEYVLYNFFCCKSKKLIAKNKILENSIDFCDYYLDIKSYVKRMIEFDMIKLILFQNKPEDLAVLERFSPGLKEDANYFNFSKHEDLYSNDFTFTEQNELLENCKNMKTKDLAFYNALLTYFN